MAVAIIIGFVLILSGFKPIGKGLIAGTIFSVINFVLMGESIPLKLGRPKSTTIGISFFLIIIRYVLMAVPLAVALKYGEWNIFAVIAGLFLVQLCIVADHVISACRKRF